MKLLRRSAIETRLKTAGQKRLFIDPLLDLSQLGEVTIDLRLGPDFLVSIVTRQPAIDTSQRPEKGRGVASFFRGTRRKLGDKFVLYPGQVVLGATLEYVGLPGDVFADVISRSSFARLGIHHNTMIQPGYRGCLPLELFNHGNNPVELLVGGRIVQARLFETPGANKYQTAAFNRKYLGNVRPTVSKAQLDPELETLALLQT